MRNRRAGVAIAGAALAARSTVGALSLQSTHACGEIAGASTHRLTTERAVVAVTVAQGWIDEGAAMCVRSPA